MYKFSSSYFNCIPLPINHIYKNSDLDSTEASTVVVLGHTLTPSLSAFLHTSKAILILCRPLSFSRLFLVHLVLSCILQSFSRFHGCSVLMIHLLLQISQAFFFQVYALDSVELFIFWFLHSLVVALSFLYICFHATLWGYTFSVNSSINNMMQLHCVPKKLCHSYFLKYLCFLSTDYNDSFTITIRNDQGISLEQNLSSHLNCVAALPDKTMQ